MVLEYLDFSYNGESSTDYGIINAQVNMGAKSKSVNYFFDEVFVATKSIIETAIPGRTKPYFQGVQRSPLQFDLTFFFQDGFTDDSLQSVKRWLDIDSYEEFYFTDFPQRRFLCMMTSSSDLYHTGTGQGFIETTWRCNDAYTYSEEFLDSVIDLSNNLSGSTISFDNQGDVDLYPECWISMVGSGNVSITNTSNNGEMLEFTDLENQETIFVDCENQDIISSLPNTYRFSNFNDTYISMVPGYNYLSVSGNCKLQFRYKFLYK